LPSASKTSDAALMLIRRERPDDAPEVRALHLAAFARPDLSGTEAPEARLVDGLRDDGDVVPELSLVAEVDGRVVGHVVCSQANIDGRPSLGLGPIGVQPDRQRSGVGTALMHAVIAAADALNAPMIVLLGDPTFYHRFGFEPAADHGITPPQHWGREYFMVRRLSAWSPQERGTFHYAPAFAQV
jgi:putative acetyltransferase